MVSVPDSDRLARALDRLDLMISLDAYITETTRFADVILPPPAPLSKRHLDVVFASLAVCNTVRYSTPVLPLGPDERDESDTLLRLTAIAHAVTTGQPEPSPDDVDDLVALTVAQQAVRDEASRAHGLDLADVLAAVSRRRGIERLLDLRLRSGPYGDGFGRHPDGLTLAAVEQAPHGIDLGPLQPRLPEVLRTASGRIELAPPVLLQALAEVDSALDGWTPSASLVLVGRRQLRSNNSWMHNLPGLTGGSNACTLQVHPDDAEARGILDGTPVRMSTPTGAIVVAAEVTDTVRPGVVCMPHGWGHVDEGTWGEVAHADPGANVNAVIGSDDVDPLSGTSVLSGIPVEVTLV